MHWGKEFLLPILPENLQHKFPLEVLVDPNCDSDEPIAHVDGSNGQVLAEITMPGMSRVSRRKLRNWLTSNGSLNLVVCFAINQSP